MPPIYLNPMFGLRQRPNSFFLQLFRGLLPITDFSMVTLKELSFVGSFCYPTEFKDSIELLASDSFDTGLLISHQFGIEDFSKALDTAKDSSVSAKVLINF